MTERSNKIIVKIGWGLLGFIFLCYFAVALIATLEGDGGFGVSHSFSGKPSFFIPAAVLPAFFIAFAIGIYWLIKRVKRKFKQPNLTVERDAAKARRPSP